MHPISTGRVVKYLKWNAKASKVGYIIAQGDGPALPLPCVKRCSHQYMGAPDFSDGDSDFEDEDDDDEDGDMCAAPCNPECRAPSRSLQPALTDTAVDLSLLQSWVGKAWSSCLGGAGQGRVLLHVFAKGDSGLL